MSDEVISKDSIEEERVIAELKEATVCLRDAEVARKAAIEAYQAALQAFNRLVAPEL